MGMRRKRSVIISPPTSARYKRNPNSEWALFWDNARQDWTLSNFCRNRDLEVCTLQYEKHPAHYGEYILRNML